MWVENSDATHLIVYIWINWIYKWVQKWPRRSQNRIDGEDEMSGTHGRGKV